MSKPKKPPVEVICNSCKHALLKKNACSWSGPSGRVWLCQDCAQANLRMMSR